MSRRRGRSRSFRPLRSAWFLIVLAFDVLVGAYLWDTQGAGPIIVAVVCVTLVVLFGRSVGKSRRGH